MIFISLCIQIYRIKYLYILLNSLICDVWIKYCSVFPPFQGTLFQRAPIYTSQKGEKLFLIKPLSKWALSASLQVFKSWFWPQKKSNCTKPHHSLKSSSWTLTLVAMCFLQKVTCSNANYVTKIFNLFLFLLQKHYYVLNTKILTIGITT